MTDEDTATDGAESVTTAVVAAGSGSEGRARGLRRRRANAPGGRHHVHKVRVTPEEEALLLQRAVAQRVTVPRLLVEAALAGDGESATATRNAVEELFALHRLLASISNNVNQIARATNATFELQPETAATLAAVRRVAERIDQAVDELSPPGGR